MNRNGDNRWVIAFRLVCLSFFCIEVFLFMFFGTHHVDEGYYHLIAHLTSRGSVPYRDYFYVQAPLFPYVYGVVFKLMGPDFIVARGFSALLALLSVLMSVKTADHLSGPRGGAVAWALASAQLHTVYYLTIIKLYAPVALCLSMMVWAFVTRKTVAGRFGVAAFCLAVGTGFRISLLPGMFVLLVLAWFSDKRSTALITSGMVAVVTWSVVFLPFVFKGGDRFFYGIYGYHLEKESFGLLRSIYHVFYSLSMLLQWYFLHIFLIIFLAALAYFIRSKNEESIFSNPFAGAAMILGVIALTHFMSQVPYTYRYLIILVPSVSGLIGGSLAARETEIVRALKLRYPGIIFGGACCLLLLSTGKPEISFYRGGAYAYLRYVARQVSLVTSPDTPILTFNHSVAVEAGRDVLKGYEMNVLSYDPRWTEERCRHVHVMNVEMLESIIRSQQLGAILITKYSFIGNFPAFYNPGEKGARPRIMAAIKSYYIKVTEFPGFGYLDSDAELYIPEKVSRHTPLPSSHTPAFQLFRDIDDRKNDPVSLPENIDLSD